MPDERKKVQAYFYRNANGEEPVRDWLIGLSKADRKRVGADIAEVEYGWPIGKPTCSPLGGGLYEVRTNLSGSRIARVLFCFQDDSMVLLHSFIKKTQKTPEQDMKLARQRKREVNRG